eukprot:112716_1
MGMKFEGISMDVDVRPMGSLLLKLALENMELVDYYKSENMITKSMIQRTDMLLNKNRNINMKEKPLLSIEFELNPLNKIADSRIKLRAEPITVDLHIPVFLRLGPFFVQERQVDMHAFERAALLQLEALQNASRAALDDAVAFHKTVAIDAEFYGPMIMLREDPSNDKSTKLVVDLGAFSIKSALKPKKGRNKDVDDGQEDGKEDDNEMNELVLKLKALKEQAAASGGSMAVNEDALSTYYDCFNVRVEDIKIYLDRDIPRNHLLTPLNMNSKIYSSIFPSDPKLPTIVLKAGVPKVSTKLASSDIRKMYFMMENLIVDSYNEITAQNEFFKKRAHEMKDNEDDNEEEEAIGVIGNAAQKLAATQELESGKSLQDDAEEEYFDEKTKLELLQKVNVLLSVQVANIQFSLVNDDNFARTKRSIPIIVSNIGGTYLYLQQRKWDLTMEAGLAEVLIEDCVCDSSQLRDTPYLMRTGYVKPKLIKQQSDFRLEGLEDEQSRKKTEFFKLNLNMIDSKSPKYENRDMLINLAAGDVIFYLRPETIYGLTEVLIKNILPSVDNKKGIRRKTSVSAQSGIDLVGEAAEKIRRERERKDKMKQQKEQEAADALAMIKKGSQKRSLKIKMKIDIVFSSLQLYICAKQFNICKNSIEVFKLDLTMYPYSMDMEVTLGNILLTDETYIADLSKDINKNYPYKAIMGHIGTKNEELKEKERPSLKKISSLKPIEMKTDINIHSKNRDPLVKFILNMYNDVEEEYPGYAMKMDIVLKGMRFTFLNRFVDEMLKWLMNSALLKIPQLITDQLDASELMAAHEEVGDKKEDFGTIPEDQEVDENEKKHDDDEKKDDAAAALPQMKIVVENMQLIIPKSSVNRDYI